MNYLELLRLVAPEAIVVLTALVVLTIGLARGGAAGFATLAASLGLVAAAVAVCGLPAEAMRFGGMLVITPLTSLFKFICLTLAFGTVLLARGDSRTMRNQSEYLAILLLATP